MSFSWSMLAWFLVGFDLGCYWCTPTRYRMRYPWYLRYLPGSGAVIYLKYRRAKKIVDGYTEDL